ncbi:MAG: diphosphomevalonate decarboxylase [Bacteriovoracaceae bacterium]|nr:diphosphomevalonate decarboxylase [Bacteriovoracaceae bacterium]
MKPSYNNQISWRAPSNIALIKYWGKKDGQFPMNPSLSFSLEKCHTEMSLIYRPASELNVNFTFEGNIKTSFGDKIKKYLTSIAQKYSWMNELEFEINSKNSFPHSSGIASSASSFAALALCLTDLITSKENKPNDFFEMASDLARQGSGSAARSVFAGYSSWGQTALIKNSSDNYARPLLNNIHPSFLKIKNVICVVDANEKSVSSTQGHALMANHPMKEMRIQQVHQQLENLLLILESGDWNAFAQLVEAEALTLHALMLTSQPSFILLKPNTLNLIQEIQSLRKSGHQVCFTLDAGANLHLLYDPSENQMIEQKMLAWKESGYLLNAIFDGVGSGPSKLA